MLSLIRVQDVAKQYRMIFRAFATYFSVSWWQHKLCHQGVEQLQIYCLFTLVIIPDESNSSHWWMGRVLIV